MSEKGIHSTARVMTLEMHESVTNAMRPQSTRVMTFFSCAPDINRKTKKQTDILMKNVEKYADISANMEYLRASESWGKER